MITHNGKEWKVCAVTPAGRSRHLAILKKYIYKEMEKGLIDHWQLWKNTGVPEDIAYLEEMARENDKVEVIDLGLNVYSAYNIHKFYNYTTDEDTVYLRFDDDITWMSPFACETLVKARLDNPEAFIVSANIVNNTLIGWIHQTIGALSTKAGTIKYERFDLIAHTSEAYAELVHQTFIEKVKTSRLSDYFFPLWKMNRYDSFSICCFAYFGLDLQPIDSMDEELWISEIRPRDTGRPNLIVGDSLVVHYGYHTQREKLDQKPYIYEFYETCAKEL